jgi:biopolymer transport protein ExbD
MKFAIHSLTGPSKEDEDFQMAPIIDCVFLLLIYFMLTTTLLKTEADLGIQLPGTVRQAVALKMPDEQIIEIHPDGGVILNGLAFDTPGSREMPPPARSSRRGCWARFHS